MGKDPKTVSRVPPQYREEHGDGAIVVLEFAHQMHCLVSPSLRSLSITKHETLTDDICRTLSENLLTMIISMHSLLFTRLMPFLIQLVYKFLGEGALINIGSMEKQDEEAFGNPPHVLRVHIGMLHSPQTWRFS